jgi:hypothetical protein
LLELVWVICYNFFRVSMHYNLMGITNVVEIWEEPLRLPGMRYLYVNWPQGQCCDVLGRQGQSGEGRWQHGLWPFRCATHQLCLSSHLCLASRIAADARPMKHSLLRFFPDQVLFCCFCHPVLSLPSLSFITLGSLGYASNNNPMACWSFSLFNLNLAQ